MLAAETVLQNRYRIIRQLGQGGMGAVYEAMDERLDATVALKETLFADERLRKQFEREARLLARMHHPALPRVSDHFAEGDGQFLVMQFIAGDDLSRMMDLKKGPFPPGQVLTWGEQLLDALDYLHTQDPQIVHRDIKPQNLKLTSRGQIILLDFGLAKGQAGGLSVATTSASIFGYTPNYAPLEQIQGLGTDARSDIYALGATLYHLMTCVKPPDALTRAAALVNGQPDPLMPANEINSSIGPGVASILARAMSQNREQRFATAAEMAAALKETSEAVTLAGKAEAATVILEPSARTLANASHTGVKQTAVGSGETTVLRKRDSSQKRRVGSLAMAVAAFVLIGIVFAAFYAYQRRNNSTATTPPGNSKDQANPAAAEPSAPTTSATQPTFDSVTQEKKTDASSQRVETREPEKKSEKASKNVDRIVVNPSHAGHVPIPAPPNVAERDPAQQNTPPESVEPEVNFPDLSRRGGRRKRMGGVGIRNLPDGTQLITAPDGTRVLVLPDGTRRVFRPGEKIDRRRGLRGV